MIVDASALLAILLAEPDARVYAGAIRSAAVRRISVANLLEAAIIVDSGKNPISSRRLDDFLEAARLQVEPVTIEQGLIARVAYRDFGKGSGSPARLNFGDCFAYALARAYDEPLLYKGDDFAHTDIRSALDADGPA